MHPAYPKKSGNFLKRIPLTNVFQHTLEYCQKAKFPFIDSIKYSCHSVEFIDDKLLASVKPFSVPPKIIIENIDSFDMAMKMHMQDINPLVLNLASNIKPGGGVHTGAKAQEEDLFRKSNYAFVVDKSFYPLKMEEVVYSPRVYIIKDSSYNLLQHPVEVSCLAVAAIRNPRLVALPGGAKKYERNIDVKIMQSKIDMIFKVAIKHGHIDLVLGALGCGAFHNPTTEVAAMFKKSVESYGKYFRTIGFAILSKHGDPNFDIFNRILMT